MTPDHRAIAAELLRARRVRDAIFVAELEGFGEPAWDMLLYLLAQGGTAAEQLLVEASGKSPVIAERYIMWLCSRSLVERLGGGVVRLTAHGEAQMTKYLDEGSNNG
ncbi:hypothetical protein [uncultured Sphingomonas sp.]|jgi:hypothetical protein|uniref:hypothetical protein n=1 Tax=uncultured Sphingomonas sp. TaxID=158754 RepID=UPI0025DB8D3B|nr:hypothetical protein [uncultured Sphingomonas sp.]